MAEVVEDEEAVGEEEDRVGEPEIVAAPLGEALEVADHVVGHVTHRAPLEAREAGAGRGLAGRYGIRSIPTILFVKGGKVLDQVIGAVPKSQLQKKLEALA